MKAAYTTKPDYLGCIPTYEIKRDHTTQEKERMILFHGLFTSFFQAILGLPMKQALYFWTRVRKIEGGLFRLLESWEIPVVLISHKVYHTGRQHLRPAWRVEDIDQKLQKNDNSTFKEKKEKLTNAIARSLAEAISYLSQNTAMKTNVANDEHKAAHILTEIKQPV